MLTSGRSFASWRQHFFATFQTARDIPGASKQVGVDGRLPFKTDRMTILSTVTSGKGFLPVTSWK